MLKIDVCDYRYERHYHIRRVEPATHSHFDHGEVDTLISKIPECNGCRHFEERRGHCSGRVRTLQAEIGISHRLRQFNDFGLGNRRTVDPDPLGKTHEMGRSVETHTITG